MLPVVVHDRILFALHNLTEYPAYRRVVLQECSGSVALPLVENALYTNFGVVCRVNAVAALHADDKIVWGDFARGPNSFGECNASCGDFRANLSECIEGGIPGFINIIVRLTQDGVDRNLSFRLGYDLAFPPYMRSRQEFRGVLTGGLLWKADRRGASFKVVSPFVRSPVHVLHAGPPLL